MMNNGTHTLTFVCVNMQHTFNMICYINNGCDGLIVPGSCSGFSC